ncbi:hypothetical protein [Streptomyces sp. NBC_00005]|uniref:hypothetical protein n=1 Tax=Streptomyces sp. NBC_00005 TaxID=2903609 RepID=UPI003245840F
MEFGPVEWLMHLDVLAVRQSLDQAGRPAVRMIFFHLGELWLRIGSATDPPTIVITRGVQVHLLDLLGVQVDRPRWPET